MDKLPKYTLEQLLEETITLPSLPRSIHTLLELLNDPNTRLSDLGKAISLDPSLSMKMLRLVNSAYYGLGQKVTSIEHAIVLLGTKVIRNLVVTATVFTQIGKMAGNLVMHNVAVGMAMDAIVAHGPLKNEYSKSDSAFVFGLLHDIGKMVLGEFLPHHWQQVCTVATDSEVDNWVEIEREIIGVDHAQIGGRLAEEWKLPTELCETVRCHHEPWNANDEKLILLSASLCVADYITKASGILSNPQKVIRLNPTAWKLSNLTNQMLIDIINAYFDKHPFIKELSTYAGE